MRILIVGAGAVGQVYGQALQKGGAEVTFFVKPRHEAEARTGFTLHHLGRTIRRERFEGFGVTTNVDEVRAQRWDQLWLAVPADTLSGDWLDAIVAATGDATVVNLSPGPVAGARVRALAGDRVVNGMISFIAYQAPLPGETQISEPGVAVWFPPGPSPFTGPAERARPVVDTLRAGGCPAAIAAPSNLSTFGTALFQIHVAALDASGWSWTKVRTSDVLPLAKRAWREAAAVGARAVGAKPPWWTGLVGPWAAKLALRLAPWIVPIDMPIYLGYHFTKVGNQTRAELDHWLAEGARFGLPTDALAELRRRMGDHATFDPAVARS